MQYPTSSSRGMAVSAMFVSEHGRDAHATMTCPALIFPTSAFVGIHPTLFLWIFCKPSMNGRSLNVAGRVVIGQRGCGMIADITALEKPRSGESGLRPGPVHSQPGPGAVPRF